MAATTKPKPDATTFEIDHVIFVIVTFIVVAIFLTTPEVGLLIENIGQQSGPLASFISGAFYSTSITAPAGAATIFFLGKVQHPVLIALIAAFGAAITDFILFKFIKRSASGSVEYIAQHFKTRYRKTRKTIRLLAIIAAGLVIASPLPDEIGVAILAAINFQVKRLFFMSYVLNFFGILALAWLGSVL